MKTVAVIFGGKTVEHDISVITALQTLKNMSKLYNIIPIYIDINGVWWTAQNLGESQTFLNFEKNAIKKKRVTFLAGSPVLMCENNGKYRKIAKVDVALLCTHGKGGEDGSLQGVLESSFVPYTSCKVASSAICMDKALTKRLLKTFKIDSVKFIEVFQGDFLSNKFKTVQKIKEKLKFPLIIKPARLGSSVGISLCDDVEELQTKLQEAFSFDDKILVEEFLKNADEFCCAVIKVNGHTCPGKVEQVDKGKIYSFDEKYLTSKEKFNKKIDNDLENKIIKESICAYKALECDGVVRIDYLFDKSKNKLYLNEVNSIPGSLACNLFSSPFRDEIDLLIDEAICAYEHKQEQVYKFSSSAIEQYCRISKNNKYSK